MTDFTLAFDRELERCRKLLVYYRGLDGAPYRAAGAQFVVSQAERALDSRDLAVMIRAYADMKGFE